MERREKVMRKRSLKLFSIVMMLVLVFASSVYAAYIPPDGLNYNAPSPRMTVVGSTATCKVTLRAAGQTIDATLELKQGSTVIASWSDTGTGLLTLSGTATVVSGVTYTLTVSGTINGVPFTPASITKTP